MKTDSMIIADGLTKSFDGNVAVDDVDLVVPRATVLGLLGPNGSGKTTIVRMLTTALRPDAGTMTVGGHDVQSDGREVRRLIGLAGQYATVDDVLTGRENLEMVGRLYHLSKREARARASELLERFDLAGEAADRVTKNYSGGMRRRLDVAASLTARPEVLFLDEPTTGLDIRSRHTLWEVIEELVEDGTTVLLTTQYLEEADHLADQIVVLNNGSVVAAGTSAELKKRVGGTVLQLTLAQRDQTDEAAKLLEGLCGCAREVKGRQVSIPILGGPAIVATALGALAGAGIEVEQLLTHEPTLDDVFLSLTDSLQTTTAPKAR